MSFDCLKKETDLFGKFLLEASAGTGKTFAIEQIATRLLVEKKEPLLLEEILMVTFTKKAAVDLKKRIFANIEKTLCMARGQLCEKTAFPEYLFSLLEQGQREKIVRLLQEALLFFDRAQIFTIHGFCLRMLQEFSFEARESSIFSFQENEDEEKLLKETFFDLLHYEDVQEEFFPSQAFIVLKKFQEPKRLLRYLYNARARESMPPKMLIGNIQDAIDSSSFSSKEFIDSFSMLFPYFKISSFNKNEIEAEVGLLACLLEKKKVTFADVEELIKTRCQLFSFLDPRNKKAKGSEFTELVAKAPQFWRLQKQLQPILQKAVSPSHIVSLLQNAFLKKLEKNLEKNDLFTFDWILKKMRSALHKKEFVEAVRAKYRAVMIDEFQDTDPLQWEIFRILFLEAKRPLSFFLVGDPKQSIYRFRKADLYTYFAAAKFLGKESRFFLDTNYRSSPSLVKALNALFSFETAPSWLSLPKLQQELLYHPVKAGLSHEEAWNDGKRSLHFFIAAPKEKEFFFAEKFFFSYLAREIHHLHADCHVAYQHMAILVKDRYQQERLKEYFLQQNVPLCSKNQKPLSEWDALWAFREFFQALFSLDRSSLCRALAGPFIQWSLQEISLDFEERLPEILVQFASLKEVLETRGFSHFFRAFLASVWKKDKMSVLERLVSRKDLSLYLECLSLFDLFVEHEGERGSVHKSLDSFFEKVKELSLENEKIPSQEGVQVMTLHGSKGLEFTVVFALGLASFSPSFEDEESIVEEDAEKMRQFYVALTRAKKRVYVPFIWGKEKKIEKGKISASDLFCSHVLHDRLHEHTISFPDFIEKMDRLKEKGHLSYEKIEEEHIGPSTCLEETELIAPPVLSLKRTSARFHSFSSLTQREVEKKENVLQDENYLFSSQRLPLGKEMGIWIHRIFAKVFSSSREERIETIIEEELFGSPFAPYCGKIQEMVGYALAQPLEMKGKRFCLQEIDRKELFAEMEFLFPALPTFDLMKGSIDLIFFHEDKYYFIDWKTNWLGDAAELYQRESLERAMQEHQYFLQASIYQHAAELFVQKAKKSVSFGGAFYLFLRGLSPTREKNQGVFAFMPERLHQETASCMQPLLL